jgi:hypothetical protein
MTTRTIHVIVAAALLNFLATGCVSQRSAVLFDGAGQITVAYVDTYSQPIYATRPTVEATINGVSGRFVVDTGAAGPSLTMTAVRRCGIAVAPSRVMGVDAWGGRVALLSATNIIVKLAPDFSIHWPAILVLPGEVDKQSGWDENFFGVLDYRTLRAGHAVIDMKQKTLTLAR